MSGILFVGGGTLGSLNPLIAVAKIVHQQSPEHSVQFWTSTNALDQQVVSAAGFRYQTMIAGKLRRYFSLRTIIEPGVVICAFFVALQRLLRQRPAAVVSAGSFVAVPVSAAAWLLRIPVIIYQQDVQLGLANRIMSLFASVRLASTPDRAKLFRKTTQSIGFALRSTITTGKAATARTQYALRSEWPTLLIIGGSSGAQKLNALVIAGIDLYPRELNILHITGERKATPVQREGYVQIAFTNEHLPDLYAAADIILCRAGSNVLAEVIAVGKAPIIIPLPHTHQEANGEEFARVGVRVLSEPALTAPALAQQVQQVLEDAEYRTNISAKIRQIWHVDGAERFAQCILQKL